MTELLQFPVGNPCLINRFTYSCLCVSALYKRSQKRTKPSEKNTLNGKMEFNNPAGIPRIPRANPNPGWQPTNLEMTDSGSRHALVTKERAENRAVSNVCRFFYSARTNMGFNLCIRNAFCYVCLFVMHIGLVKGSNELMVCFRYGTMTTIMIGGLRARHPLGQNTEPEEWITAPGPPRTPTMMRMMMDYADTKFTKKKASSFF